MFTAGLALAFFPALAASLIYLAALLAKEPAEMLRSGCRVELGKDDAVFGVILFLVLLTTPSLSDAAALIGALWN